MFVILFFMSLTRKVRKVGSSLVVTIPSHIAEAYNINEGTILEYQIGNNNHLILKKRGNA